MDIDLTINKRQSTRSFKNKNVSWKSVLEAIDSALQGPFAGNQNHLKFLIVEDSKTIKDIAKQCSQNWIEESSLVLVVCSDDTHLENLYGERGRVYSRQQAGAAIQTILLRLTSLGLDSCWVGAYTDELIKQQLKIPQQIQIEAIIPIGYASPNSPKKPVKKDLSTTIYWEKWKQDKRPTVFAEPKHKHLQLEDV